MTNANLGTLLKNLVNILIADGVTGFTSPADDSDGTNIGTYRPTQADGGYITKKQIMAVNGSTIDAIEYATLKNYVTSEGWFKAGRFGGKPTININTADQYVLQAVIGSISGVNSADRDKIVQAILEYRTGREYNTGTTPWTETITPIGAGNPNPFDGLDSNRGDDTNLDPTVSDFASDGLDNDGDGLKDVADPDEQYQFAGGARGEFNALIDEITGSNSFNGITNVNSTFADNVKNNADPGQTPDTVGLDFQSKFFEITSTGIITQGDERLAESKIVRIVEREK